MFVASALPTSSVFCLRTPPLLLNTSQWHRNPPSIGQSTKSPFFPESFRSPGPRGQHVPNSIILYFPRLRRHALLSPRTGWHRRSYFAEEQANTLGTGGDANKGWGPQHHLDA
ncbi:hypothetical protein CGRA01v4_01379 [Colletotrichum graminicola]|nr:hypothetical protein CGRA01v4_01379 [Colletotrichum graminicola]